MQETANAARSDLKGRCIFKHVIVVLILNVNKADDLHLNGARLMSWRKRSQRMLWLRYVDAMRW